MIEFLETVGKLKTNKRRGWIQHGIPPQVESISDHMYRMSIIALAIKDSSIDKSKLIKLCLTHDIAEAVVGDITPLDDISKQVKSQLENGKLLFIMMP